jgi:hypothetical protein
LNVHKGFADCLTTLTFAQEGLNVFYDAENPEIEHESMAENLHKVQLEFEEFYQNIDTYQNPEDFVVKLVEKYRYSKEFDQKKLKE